MISVGIVQYGVGNIGSLVNAFSKIGAQVHIVKCYEDLKRCDLVVLPGVGSFDAAIKYIDQHIPEVRKIAGEKPVLGICLGMQIMFEESQEGVLKGLCWFSGKVKMLQSSKIPHIGWNTISILRRASIVENIPEGSYFYFAHSYCVYYDEGPIDKVCAVTEFGNTKFVSIIFDEDRLIIGTQFHPERSSKVGLQLLRNVLNLCRK